MRLALCFLQVFAQNVGHLSRLGGLDFSKNSVVVEMVPVKGGR